MNEKWFALDVSSVEKKLKTNAASGLSPKAARSRYKKGGEPFYITEKKSFVSMLGEIISDFSLILLIICSVMAICFTEYTIFFCVCQSFFPSSEGAFFNFWRRFYAKI